MIRDVPGPLLLWLALSFFASLGCEKPNSGVSPDGGDGAAGVDAPAEGPDAGAADEGASSCKGPPPSCVLGYTVGTAGVAHGYLRPGEVLRRRRRRLLLLS
jgi:hypothetical protein